MKKRFAFLLAVLLTASLFSACTSNQGTPGPDGSGASQPAETGSGSNSAPQQKDLVVATPYEVATMDPHYYASNGMVIFMVYEPLFITRYRTQSDGSLSSYIEPALATGYEMSADATVYTITLRDDVTFSDGTRLTADDVVFSLNRAKESPMMALYAGAISQAAATNEHTVEITMMAPSSNLILNLTNVMIMSRAFTEAAGDAITEDAMGTGPYTMTEIAAGQKYTLTARTGYYKGKAPIDRVVFRVIPDATTQLTAFEAGEVDVVTVSAANWADISASDQYQTAVINAGALLYFSFNMEKEPFDDVRVRQAVNYAIDREGINLIATDGTSLPAYTMAAPGIVACAASPETPYTYDPGKAQALLAEAGYGDGLVLDEPITVMGGLFNDIAIAIQSQLSLVGISVDIELMESNVLYQRLGAGDFLTNVMGMGLPADFGYWGMLVCTPYIGSTNFSRYSNPRVDTLFDLINKEPDESKRAEYCREVVEILNTDAPFAPVLYGTNLMAFNKNLRSAYPLGTGLFSEFFWDE